MGFYVDGFVVPVSKKKIKEYRKIALLAGKVWMEHGALQYIECLGDDVPKGKLTSFPKSVKMKPSETLFFSWIVYKSKSHRSQVLKKVMKDKRLQGTLLGTKEKQVFAADRMIYGGFKQMINIKAEGA